MLQSMKHRGPDSSGFALYGPATDILSAAVEGQKDAAAATQQIELFKHLTRWKGDYLPASNPASVVQRMVLAILTGELTDSVANQVLSRHAFGTEEEWKRNLERAREQSGALHTLAGNMGLTDTVVLDPLGFGGRSVVGGPRRPRQVRRVHRIA